MSGYLEVKYPFKSNLGLNPFKSWKRQWCILRPSPTCSGGGSLAVYCSEAGAPAGTVELPSGCVVRRAKSRTRPHAFAVFSADEPRKPRILLAAQSLHDAHIWMEKIRTLLNGNKLLGTECLLKDTYSVTILTTELSRKCGLSHDSVLTLSTSGLLISRIQKLGTFIDWKYMSDAVISENCDKNRTCVLTVDSNFSYGGGELRFSTPLASELVGALKQEIKDNSCAKKKLSKSEGDLRPSACDDNDLDESRRSSWHSNPSEVSMDDTDLLMLKESKRLPSGQLSRYSGAELVTLAPAAVQHCNMHSLTSFDDSMSDRRSLVSIASGIYEEIPDLPTPETPTCDTAGETGAGDIAPDSDTYCAMGRDVVDAGRGVEAGGGRGGRRYEEPTYESVAECIYATMRRTGKRYPPPPLPPRLPFGTMKLGESWNSRMNGGEVVTRHSSLGSLPRCCRAGEAGVGAGGGGGGGAEDRAHYTRTLPKPDKSKQPFSVFRKRLKSDSRIISSPKSETSKENKDVETKKKKFDFTPTRDIFKSFKVSRKMKNLKITQGNLAKGETKSCEFLDETEHVTTNRCSKSVECLEGADEIDDFEDLSIQLNDDVTALTLPQEIVDLILRSREQMNKVRLREEESDYMPMSPVMPPPPIEHHYIVMSPRTNLA